MSATEIAPTPDAPAPVTPAAPVAPVAAAPVETKPAEPVKELLKAEPAKPVEIAPFEIKPVDGGDKELASAFAKEARAAGLDSTKAQALYDAQAAAFAARATAQREQWLEQSMKHPTLGGTKLEESVATANAALTKFASPEFMALLNQQRLDVHPEMLAAWHAVGVAISPDARFVTGKPTPAAMHPAEAFYKNMPKA